MSASTAERKAWKIANKLAMVNYSGGACVMCGDSHIDRLMITNEDVRSDNRFPIVAYIPEYGAPWSVTLAFLDGAHSGVACTRCVEQMRQAWAKGLIHY